MKCPNLLCLSDHCVNDALRGGAGPGSYFRGWGGHFWVACATENLQCQRICGVRDRNGEDMIFHWVRGVLCGSHSVESGSTLTHSRLDQSLCRGLTADDYVMACVSVRPANSKASADRQIQLSAQVRVMSSVHVWHKSQVSEANQGARTASSAQLKATTHWIRHYATPMGTVRRRHVTRAV